MTTIGLIRHGITDWNSLGRAQGHSDIPLNEVGRRQAAELGKRLANEGKWDMIITSDLSRAFETGKIIGSKLNIPVSHTDERIREIYCGLIEGTTEEERLERWGPNWRKLDLGMEKYEDVAKRGLQFLEDIVRSYNGKRILVVSHGFLIGLTLKRLLPEIYKKTYIDNTAITILNFKDDKWDCLLYNCSKHLQ